MYVNEEATKKELKATLGDDIDGVLLEDCVKVCRSHNLSGEDFGYKLQAFRYNSGTSAVSIELTAAELDGLRKQIQQEASRAGLSKAFGRANLTGLQSRNFGRTPVKAGTRQGVSGPLAATPVKVKLEPAARPQDGFDMSGIEEKRMPVAGPSRVTFVGPAMDEAARRKRAYHYMYEKVSERSEVLDDRIDYFGELVKEYYNIEELGDPASVTDEDVVVVGRITIDSETNAKLNEASLHLETSRMMGSGVRVTLRFDPGLKIRKGKRGAGGLGLFPGAIIALKGKNGGGGSFLATEILCHPPLEPSPVAMVKSETGSSQFSMCIASGPFTSDLNLKYEPLQKLMNHLNAMKPAVTLLVGPFVDASHSSIRDGNIDATPQDMFHTEFVARLRNFLDNSPGSIVLMVPSVRDILSDHAVFPQCELGSELASDPRIHMLPNPARFTINGIHFAASSVDVLFHLRKEELFKRASDIEPLEGSVDPEGQNPNDPMACLCRHILQQRNFYPLFPVPLELAHEVNLDMTHSELLSLSPEADEDEEGGDEGHGKAPLDGGADPSKARCAPDVLIVPSRLKQFFKVVDNTVAINPSFLTKSMYTTLHYAGHTAPGPAKDRIKVEINRLEGTDT